MKKLTIVLIATVLGFVLPTKPSFSAVFTQDGRYRITGYYQQLVTNFSGTGSSININTGFQVFPSGEITFSLNSSQDSRLIYDFESGQLILDAHLLLDAPILDTLGESPVSFNLIERADIPAFNILDLVDNAPEPTLGTYQADGTVTQPLLPPQSLNPSGSVSLAPGRENLRIELAEPLPNGILFVGGGKIESGIFAGFEYYNSNRVRVEPFPRNVPKDPPRLPSPDGGPFPPYEPMTIFQVTIPEPSTALGSFTILGLVAFWRRVSTKDLNRGR